MNGCPRVLGSAWIFSRTRFIAEHVAPHVTPVWFVRTGHVSSLRRKSSVTTGLWRVLERALMCKMTCATVAAVTNPAANRKYVRTGCAGVCVRTGRHCVARHVSIFRPMSITAVRVRHHVRQGSVVPTEFVCVKRASTTVTAICRMDVNRPKRARANRGVNGRAGAEMPRIAAREYVATESRYATNPAGIGGRALEVSIRRRYRATRMATSTGWTTTAMVKLIRSVVRNAI